MPFLTHKKILIVWKDGELTHYFLRIFCVVTIALTVFSFHQHALSADQKFHFRLLPGPLEKNIFQIAKTANVQIFFFPEIVLDKRSSEKISGNYNLPDILSKLLAGTELVYVMNRDHTIIIKKLQNTPAANRGKPPQETGLNAENPALPRRFDEIITIGTRRTGRTITNSAAPIDVLQTEVLKSTGYVDMTGAFRTLIPSFNIKRLALNDGASFVRPVTMRSSPADHVLLLMNGKRRHRSATVMIGTGHATTSGSQGQDFNVIPLIALKDVEILRDGASALYGSDAIAGVVNMALKDRAEGGEISAHIGQYYQGGGTSIDIQANLGVPITDEGFLNLSAQYTRQNQTTTNGIHAGAKALIDAGVPGVPWPATNPGEPTYQTLKTSWNGGLALNENLSLYLFGNYMSSDTEISFFYRQSLPGGGFDPHATYEDSQFEGTAAHPEDFNLRNIYPGGFAPIFSGRQYDISTVAGLKSTTGEAFRWDISFRWGKNKIEYGISNTINPSLGVNSPTSFKPGSLAQSEYQVDAEALYDLPTNIFESDLTLSIGISYRNETYSIGEGDEASYAIGPLRDLPAGSNGFQGYSPDIAGSFGADSYAVYLDLETDIIDDWSVAIAGRYENYQAFGDNFSYRLSTRFSLNNQLALRGTLSTGFRAPASGQLYGTSQTSQLTLQGNFILDAVLVLESEAAGIFGAMPLKPETSLNMSAGIVATLENDLTVTLDFYQIDVDDRLLLLAPIPTTEDQRIQLAAIGYPNGLAIQQVRFFQNKLDTRVRGVDLITTYGFYWPDRSLTNINLALNYNQQILRTAESRQVFSDRKRFEFEEGIPRWNSTLSVNHKTGDFELWIRATYYGAWKRRSALGGDSPFLNRRPAVLVDLQVTYQIFKNVEIYLGGRNILNKKPPLREPLFDKNGLRSDNHSVYGISGGYYYTSLNYTF